MHKCECAWGGGKAGEELIPAGYASIDSTLHNMLHNAQLGAG